MSHLKYIFASALVILSSVPMLAFFNSEQEARGWCDTNVLNPVEGIWEYPEDGARVLIRADETYPGTFVIYVLSTPDCRLETGDIIGRLHTSIDTHQFRLSQYSRKDKSILANPYDCIAKLSTDGESLQVKSPKMKFKININTLLPRFWRIVKMTIDNPSDKLPAGLIKIYPGYDHNGSLRRKPRTL